MKRLLFGVALAGLLSAVTLGAAPKSSSSASIILNPPSGTLSLASTSWTPHLGDYVSFTTTYPSSLDSKGLWVQVVCYQDGALVYGQSGYPDREFLLGSTSSPWRDNGGPATCRADLYYWSNNATKMNIVASTEFAALGW